MSKNTLECGSVCWLRTSRDVKNVRKMGGACIEARVELGLECCAGLSHDSLLLSHRLAAVKDGIAEALTALCHCRCHLHPTLTHSTLRPLREASQHGAPSTGSLPQLTRGGTPTMWRTTHLLLLLVALVIATVNVAPLHAQQPPNQPIHQHIPIIPDDLLPAHTTTTASYTTTSTTPLTRHTQQPTLAYLTPWNRDGYDVSLNYSYKFTHLSPVWFQIKLTSHPSKQHVGRNTLAILITGEHDVDKPWIERVRAANPTVHIVPRFIVEMTAAHLTKLVKTDKMHRQLHKRVIEIADRYGLDGAVLEVSDLHAVMRRDKDESTLVKQANALLRTFGQALHAHQPRLSFTLVVRPPFPRSPYFGPSDYQAVHEHVDYFSLMTYDFSSGQDKPGPNSPLPWARQSMYALIGDKATAADKAKVLMGLNMYGMRWKAGGRGGEAILGRDYVEMVGKAAAGKVTRRWEEEAAEERTEVEGETVAYYPNERSVEQRVQLANRESCGLSLWEIGQGLSELYEQL